MTKVKGLQPIYTSLSKILILCTIPSDKSRTTNSYYNNGNNRFWKVICEYLGISVPDFYNKKLQILKDNDIAVWDLIDTCDIEGSQDSTIENPTYNNIQDLLNKTDIKLILLNGKTAFKMYEENFKDLPVEYMLMPSTSSQNATFDKQIWIDALSLVDYYYREDAVKYYVKLAKRSNSPLYETIETNSGFAIKFDDSWLLPKAAVESGVTIESLRKALIIAIKQGKL